MAGKGRVVLAVLDDVAARLMPAPNLGDTRANLVAIVDAVVRVLADADVRSLIAAIIAESTRNEPLAQTFRLRLLDLRRDELRNVLEGGIARGEFDGDLDVEAAADLLIGPVTTACSSPQRAAGGAVRGGASGRTPSCAARRDYETTLSALP